MRPQIGQGLDSLTGSAFWKEFQCPGHAWASTGMASQDDLIPGPLPARGSRARGLRSSTRNSGLQARHHTRACGVGTRGRMLSGPAQKTDPQGDHSKVREDTMAELLPACVAPMGSTHTWSTLKKGEAVQAASRGGGGGGSPRTEL